MPAIMGATLELAQVEGGCSRTEGGYRKGAVFLFSARLGVERF